MRGGGAAVASLALLAATALPLAGCDKTANTFAVRLTIDVDPSVSDGDLERVKLMDLKVDGAETFATSLPVTTQFLEREGRLLYRPGVPAGAVTFTVILRDTTGAVAGQSQATPVSLVPGGTAEATVLVLGAGPPLDGGVDLLRVPDLRPPPDLAAPDLVPDDAAPLDGGLDAPVDASGDAPVDASGDAAPDLVLVDLAVPDLRPPPDLTPTPLAGKPVAYVTGKTPTSLRAFDVDGDGKLDLISTCLGDNTVVVLRGNGDGTFGGPTVTALPTGTGPSVLAIAELNTDGHIDAIVGGIGNSSLTVLINQGGGTFALQKAVAVPFPPQALAVGDWNSDNLTDVAVSGTATTGAATVALFNYVAGALKAGGTFGVTQGPYGIVSADLNGDALADLAVGGTSFLQQTGPNTFAGQTDVATGGAGVKALLPVQIDGAFLDLVAADGINNVLVVLIGLNNFKFKPAIALPTGGKTAWALGAADFDLDFNIDIVVANRVSGDLSVFLGKGGGQFRPAFVLPATPVGGTVLSALAVGDFDGDGRPDVAVAGETASTISVLLNKP